MWMSKYHAEYSSFKIHSFKCFEVLREGRKTTSKLIGWSIWSETWIIVRNHSYHLRFCVSHCGTIIHTSFKDYHLWDNIVLPILWRGICSFTRKLLQEKPPQKSNWWLSPCPGFWVTRLQTCWRWSSLY